MANNDHTRDLTRQNLERDGIHYDTEVYDPSQSTNSCVIPDHVDAVREILLTFNNIVPPGGWEIHLKEQIAEFRPKSTDPLSNVNLPKSAIIALKRFQNADLHAGCQAAAAKLDRDEKTAENARKLLNDPESGWSCFWRQKVFTLASDDACMQPGFDPALDTWSLYEDLQWDLWSQGPRRPKSSRSNLTQPKPDLTYAFPMLHELKDQEDCYHGFDRDEFRQCFSLPALGKLNSNGVLCTHTTGLQQWMKASKTKARISASRLTCFPWAVVEMKPDAENLKTTVEKCYCQAANASALALELQAQLFDHDCSGSFNLPPVIVFTCIGPNVKVWLAFQTTVDSSGIRQRRMTCIWSATVELTWGVAALRVIIMNAHVWASRLLKPKIQAFIFQALSRLGPGIQRNSETPTVHQAQDAPLDEQANIDLITKSLESTKLEESGCDRRSSSRVLQSTEQDNNNNLSSRAASSDNDSEDSNKGPFPGTEEDSDISWQSKDSEGSHVDWTEGIETDARTNSEDDSDRDSDVPEDFDTDTGNESGNDSNCESDISGGTSVTKTQVEVSPQDLKRWKKASLQTLDGRQIADIPTISRLFYNLTQERQLALTRRALGSGNMPGDCYNFGDQNRLSKLLDWLNQFLGSDQISVEMFLQQKAYSKISRSLSKMAKGWVQQVNLWKCLYLALSCRSGYTCADILEPELSNLPVKDREELEHHAFTELNDEDQKSAMLR